jgi:hypothetical protein
MDPERRFDWARAAVWGAAILSAAALAGCGSAHARRQVRQASPLVPARPAVPAHAPRPAAPAAPAAPARPAHAPRPPVPDPVAPGRLAASTAPDRVARTARGRPAPRRQSGAARRARRGTWLIDPDEPLPRDSRWWPVLAVARRFAVADMSYEVGKLGTAVRRTVTRTCTPAFAAELFSHRPSLPPGVRADQVLQRVVGVTALKRLRREAVVLVTVRSVGRGGERGVPPEAFKLPLTPRAGGWRVSGIDVV